MRQRLVLVPTILLAISAIGADWRQFRGPGGSGVSGETGLPTTWSSKENIIWRTPLPGPGTSCPIVVGQRVYLTCYSGYGLVAHKKDDEEQEDMSKLMRHVLCIDRASGKIVWTKDFRPVLPESAYRPGNDSQHGYASSTIASDGQRLYVFFGKSGVYCLDLNGNTIWNESVGTGTSGWGSANSPLLYKDRVIINASVESGALVALYKDSGKVAWRVKGIRSSWNTPVLAAMPGGATELVVSDSNNVLGFDPDGGEELWRVTGFKNYVCPSVVTDSPHPQPLSPGGRGEKGKGVVYVVRSEGAMAIKAGGRGDVTESHVLWRAKGSSLVPSPVLYDGRLCCNGNGAFCLDVETGNEMYRERINEAGSYYASGLVADGKIYYVSRTGGTIVIDAGAQFKKLAHNKFEDDNSRTNASPIAHDGCLLLRTDQNLYCIGKK